MGDSLAEEVKCDMICEAVRDLVSLAALAPFHRVKSSEGFYSNFKSHFHA